MSILYQLENVSFSYKNHSKLNALSGLSLSIHQGQRLAVLGESGSGKSTFLKLLHALLFPSSGKISYKNKPLISSPSDVSFLLQSYGLFPWKTIEENLALPLLLNGQTSNPDLIDQWLDRLGLREKKTNYPKMLSGGQKQRLALGRAMINSPGCLLLDEPFSALDTFTKENLQDFTLALSKENQTTLVLVTHTIEEAVFLATHFLLFTNEGYLYFESPLQEPFDRNSPTFYETVRLIREKLKGG